jgi:hypothetical protein
MSRLRLSELRGPRSDAPTAARYRRICHASLQVSDVRDRFDVPSSPTKPQISRPCQNRPFQWGFSLVFVLLFQSPVTLAVSRADFSLPSPHPKIPFPAVGFTGAKALRELGNVLGVLGPKWTFGARLVIIASLVRGLRTVGSILPEHREVARRQRRVANDLRPQRARGLVRGTQVRSSC